MYSLFYFLTFFTSSLVQCTLTSIQTSTGLAWTIESKTTARTNNTCAVCLEQTCRCSSIPSLLNCSSASWNLTISDPCSTTIVWDIVDFSSRHLEHFDHDQLHSLRMRHLLLNENSIRMISEGTFDSIADHLFGLDLSINAIVHVSSQWLNSKLIQLKTLTLASNQIESFVEFDQIHFPSLELLNISHNRIDHFPRAIRQWTSLIKLDVSFNRLISVPRFALMGLNNLTWLSFAGNRNLTCIVQDSFKYLKSLKYLDLSQTNLFAFDACIFIQLTDLHVLHMEELALNCSSCWLPIARKHTRQLVGQCRFQNHFQQLDTLTDRQLETICEQSSVDCSVDYCEAGSIDSSNKTDRILSVAKHSRPIPTKTIEILLGVIFGILSLFIVISLSILFVRWRQGKKIFCCHSLQNRSTIAEATRRRREQHKEIINSNPAVIESVVTHGANMNVSSYSHQNYGYFNEEASNHKRKLYNPMFADSPSVDRQSNHQGETLSDDQIYSEHL